MKKICVIGAGRWGSNHIKTLYSMDALGGIVETNGFALEPFLAQFPNIPLYKNIDDALEANYDGYTIATPAETHFKIAKKIISAGKHVLVEKPITLQTREAKELEQLAAKKHVNLMVGHVLLFLPRITRIFTDDDPSGEYHVPRDDIMVKK